MKLPQDIAQRNIVTAQWLIFLDLIGLVIINNLWAKAIIALFCWGTFRFYQEEVENLTFIPKLQKAKSQWE